MGDEMTRQEMELELRLLEEKNRRKEADTKTMAIVGGGYSEFWSDRHRYRVLKGGRGSKKSTTTALWFIANIIKHPKANAVVVRKTYNTHKDSTFAQLKWATKQLGCYEDWTFTISPLEATYKTGQKILFRGFDDVFKLTSITVHVGVLCWVWLEEAFEIDLEEDFNTLDESIRGEMPKGLYKQLTLTYNPWVNAHWTKKRFFDNSDPNAFTLTTTHKCNEYMDDADHKMIDDLEFSNPDRYKVVGLGEYGIPGGTFFDEFRTDIHVCKPFIIPKHWRRYFAMDYGLDMLAGYWIAIDDTNKAYFYKEVYKSDLIISAAAREILALNTEDDNIYQYFAPPDLWNRRQETGKSAMEIFYDNGIRLVKADNERVQGWLNVKEWLAPFDDEQGIPTANVQMFSNCTNLIRCIAQIKSSDKDPNDVAKEPHELTHSLDAMRYFIAGRPIPYRAKIRTVFDTQHRFNTHKPTTGGHTTW